MVDSKKSVLRPQMANVPDGFKRAVGYEGQVNWLAAASKQAIQTSGEAFEAAKNAIQVASDAKGFALDALAKVNANVPYVTPEMFGAVGDGVSDDTEAIQRAINSKNVTFSPNKTYNITDNVYISESNTFINGNGSTLRQVGKGKHALCLIGSDSKYIRNIYIFNINLTGDYVWNGHESPVKEGTFDGIYAEYANSVYMYNVNTQDNSRDGVHLEKNCWYWSFINCSFFRNGRNGFFGINESSSPSTRNATTLHFYNPYFGWNFNSGLFLNGTTDVFFGGAAEGNKTGVTLCECDSACSSIVFNGFDIEGNIYEGVNFAHYSGSGSFQNISFRDGQIVGSQTNKQLINFDEQLSSSYFYRIDFNTILNNIAGKIFLSNKKIYIQSNMASNIIDDDNIIIRQPYIWPQKKIYIDSSKLSQFNPFNGVNSVTIPKKSSVRIHAPVVQIESLSAVYTDKMQNLTISAYSYENSNIISSYTYKFNASGLCYINCWTSTIFIYNNSDDDIVLTNVSINALVRE